jgi:hypothetical protein
MFFPSALSDLGVACRELLRDNQNRLIALFKVVGGSWRWSVEMTDVSEG